MNECNYGGIPSYCQAPEMFSLDSKQILQNWGENMRGVGRELARMNGEVDEVKKELRTLNRSPKPIKTGEYLIKQKDGDLVYVIAYENETAKLIPFFENITGELNVYQLRIVETEEEYWAIKIVETNQIILGEFKKLNQNHLYESFVDLGIRICGRIPRSKRKELLYEYFAPQITNEAELKLISLRAGWNNKKFISEDQFSFAQLRLFANSPVAKRVFLRGDLGRNVADEYFRKLRMIENEGERIIVFLLPYLAVMTSLLVNEGVSAGIVINVVASDKIDLKKCCSCFQIFNRQQLHVQSMHCRDAEFEKILRESRDENLIFDSRIERTDTSYEKNKIQRLENKLLDLVSGEQTIEKFKGVESQVILVNDQIICHENTYNIFWSGNKRFLDLEKELDVILGTFVNAMETNIDEAIRIIRKYAKGIQNSAKAYSAIWEIVNQFWHQHGYSLKKYLNITRFVVARMPFDQMLGEGKFDTTMQWSVFVNAVRHQLNNWTVVHKDYAKMNEAILYDENYIWIHPKAMTEILAAEEMSKNLDLMLLIAKEQDYLVTSGKGRTIRIQIAGQQYEYYKFQRNAFNLLGNMDFIMLARR